MDLQILTEKKGKVMCVAKGGRKSIHRFVNVLNPGNYVEMWLSPLKGRYTFVVESGDVLESYPEIKRHPLRLFSVMLTGKFLSLILPPLVAREDIYNGLLGFLSSMKSSKMPYELSLLFFLFLLQREGYLPSFKRCSKCGTPLEEGKWNRKEKRIECLRCGKGGVVISVAGIHILRNASMVPYIFRIKPSHRCVKELEVILRDNGDNLAGFTETFLALKHLKLKKEVQNVEREG